MHHSTGSVIQPSRGGVPEPLAGLLLDLTRQPHRYLGVGSPNPSTWLFPGMQPGRPLTAARLGERLRAL